MEDASGSALEGAIIFWLRLRCVHPEVQLDLMIPGVKVNAIRGSRLHQAANADVSLCCGPNGCQKAVANVPRAISSPLSAGKNNSSLSTAKASEAPNKRHIEGNGRHNAMGGNKRRCEPLLWTQWMPKGCGKSHSRQYVASER